MSKRFLNILYPENYCCLGCNVDVFDNPYLFCKHCKTTLPFIKGKVCVHCGDILISDGNYCKRCKNEKFYCDRAVAPFEYEGKIKNLILGLKFESQKYNAIGLAKFMADCFVNTNLAANYIIPVPLSEERLKTRGFNQAKVLADELAKHINIKVKDDILFRIKETNTQIKSDFQTRQTNLLNAFKVKSKSKVKDKIILLVDDVYTTGATIKECAKTLKQAGAKAVYAITTAHTIFKPENEE